MTTKTLAVNGSKWVAIPIGFVLAFAGGAYVQGQNSATATANKERLGEHVALCNDQLRTIEDTLRDVVAGLARVEGRLSVTRIDVSEKDF